MVVGGEWDGVTGGMRWSRSVRGWFLKCQCDGVGDAMILAATVCPCGDILYCGSGQESEPDGYFRKRIASAQCYRREDVM